jgi:hypothetical protein
MTTITPAHTLGLRLAAQTLDDLEDIRIAQENRLRSLTTAEPDKNGTLRGPGFAPDDPEVRPIALTVQGLIDLEHQATLELRRVLRRHPLGDWVKQAKGIGEKQGARLVAAIGDPFWNDLHNRPRGVYELFAYAGYHNGDDGLAVRRRKGTKSNWSAEVKMRAFLCAQACVKQLHCPRPDDGRVEHVEGCTCSPYRVTYDRRRARTDATHPDWNDGHSHQDAIRVAAKAILKDLWHEARALHGYPQDWTPRSVPDAPAAAVSLWASIAADHLSRIAG